MKPGANVAEISAFGRRGSGLLVGPGLVLTSMHVVLGKERPYVIGGDMRADVRLRGDVLKAEVKNSEDWTPDLDALAADPALRWRPASLLWPPAGTRPYAHDIALLRILDWDATHPSPAEGELALAALTRPQACIAYGFPVFYSARFEARTMWRCYLAEGHVRHDEAGDPSDARRPMKLGEGPLDSAEWEGMSGSVLMIDDQSYRHVIGVVQARIERVHGNARLLYWPLDAIPADDSFWTLSGIARLAPAARPSPGSRPTQAAAGALRERFFEFDRGLEAGALRRWLIGDRPNAEPRYMRVGPPKRPGAIVVTGHVIDEPGLCLARFADVIGSLAFTSRADNYRHPLILRCGPYNSPPEDRIDHILWKWAERYHGTELMLDADVEQIIAEGLRSKDRPRLIVLEHDTDKVLEGCSKVADRVLEIVARAWVGVDPAEPPPIVILTLVTGEKFGPADTAFLPAEQFPDKSERFAAELKKIVARHPDLDWCTGISSLDAEPATARDFDDWLKRMADKGLSIPPQLGDAVRANLGNVDRFRMRYAKAAANLALDALSQSEN